MTASAAKPTVTWAVQTFSLERQVQTECRHKAIRNARSIPDIDISNLTVSNVALISMFAAPVPGHLRSLISATTRALERLKYLETGHCAQTAVDGLSANEAANRHGVSANSSVCLHGIGALLQEAGIVASEP